MRTKVSVVIRANERVKVLAQEALDLQDACNPLAVAHSLVKSMRYFNGIESDNRQEFYGSDYAGQNPVTVAILDKLCSLASHPMGADYTGQDDFHACERLSRGVDVEWVFYTL
jgi:hypothetical protein